MRYRGRHDEAPVRRALRSIRRSRAGRADIFVLLMVFGLLFVVLMTGMFLMTQRRARSVQALATQEAVVAVEMRDAALAAEVASDDGATPAPPATDDGPPDSMRRQGSPAGSEGEADEGRREKMLAAMDAGLGFLAAAVNDDGSFGPMPPGAEKGDVGITALVVWAWAQSPAELREKHAAVFGRGVDFIVSLQQESGAIVNPGQGLDTYKTSTAILALQNVDPLAHKAVIAKARDFLVGLQVHEGAGIEKSSPYYGSWGYKQGKPSGNMSTTQFALDALNESRLDKDDEAYKRVIVFLQRCQNRSESNDFTETVRVGDDGGFRYDPGLRQEMSEPQTGEDGKTFYPSYASMTYAGLKSLIHAHLSKDDPRVKAAVAWIGKHYTLEENHGMGTRDDPARAKQGLYYYYLTFARALDAYGEKRIAGEDGDHVWAHDLADKLLSLQREDGSWVNEEDRWWESNPVLVTAYTVSALAVALENLE